MEHALSLFVRSIFVDNMIFAYFLGMCSYLAVSKNVKTSLGLGVAVTFVLLITLPVNYLLERYVLSAGALAWFCYARFELPEFHPLHCGYCGHRAVGRDDCRKIFAVALCVAGHFSAADSRELRHHGLRVVHAAACRPRCHRPQSPHEHVGRAGLRAWLRPGLDVGHRGAGGHPRKNGVQQCACTVARFGHHVHHRWLDGNGVLVLQRTENLRFNSQKNIRIYVT